MKGSMEPVRHSTVTYIENLRSQRKGAAECPEMSVLVKEFLVLPLHMELMFCRRKGAHTVQNWDQFLWWIIIIHLCLPSLKILAWWPAGTYTEKECRARPHSAIPFQNQECFRSSGRADLCRQLQKSKLNLYWTFSLSGRHTGMLVRAVLFLWHYLCSFPMTLFAWHFFSSCQLLVCQRQYHTCTGCTLMWDLGCPFCFNAFQEWVFIFGILTRLGEKPKLSVLSTSALKYSFPLWSSFYMKKSDETETLKIHTNPWNMYHKLKGECFLCYPFIDCQTSPLT